MHMDLEVQIDSDLRTVFGWLARPEKARQWMSSVSETEIIDETPGMLGTTFRERVEEDGQGIEMLGTVTAFEPNKRVGFHLESKVNTVNVDYWLEPVGGTTRLQVTSDVSWKFPASLATMFRGGAVKRKLSEQMEGELDWLKQLCESSAGSRGPGG